MANFQDIIGQEQIVTHLQNAIKSDKIAHAYIINGERSSGKEFVAKVFATALQCEQEDGQPCCSCKTCQKSINDNNPDIIRVTHEKPNTISVDDIRDKINKDILLKPYSNKRKVYIMNEGEKMTIQAQNALLKTLEEPPSYATIIILTTNLEALLPTVLSRCVTLNMRPVQDELVKEFLMKEVHIPEYKAEVCVAFARGNLGKAKALAASEEFDNIKNETVTLLKHIKDMDISEIVGCIKHITEYQFDINDYLDMILVWYRDVLLFKATNDANHLIFKDEIQYIRKVADRSAYEGIEDIIDALEKAKARLKANVNFELSMELLLLTIKEN